MNNKKIFIISLIIFFILISILIINNIINNKNNLKTGNLIELTYNQIEEKLNNKDSFILIVSKATCSHCASYKPKVKNVASEYHTDIYYIDYDTETKENSEKLLNFFNLDGSTPITLFIKDGKETSILNRVEGDISKNKIISSFKKMGFIK